MRPLANLNQIPPAQMTPDEFAACAIVVGVEVNPDPASPRRLMVPREELSAFDELREELTRCLPNMQRGMTEPEKQGMLDRLLMGIVAMDLQTDGACNRIPGGRPMVIARTDAKTRFGPRAMAERIHRELVTEACGRGEAVHEECLAYYQIPAPARNRVQNA